MTIAAATPTRSPAASVVPTDVQPLSEEHKKLVLATAPILAEHGLAITKLMYERMLAAEPKFRNLFSLPAQASGAQPKALAAAVVAYASNINDLSPIVPVVERIAAKHAALGVKAEHYPIVAEHLFAAIVEVLGAAFTDDLKNAWYHAYWQLARIFIEAEATLTSQAPWTGWQEFTVSERTDESPTITSFSLVPKDSSLLPLAPYKPGQYLTVRTFVDQLDCFQNRHYSLSDSPSSSRYRITVKREAGSETAPGLVSNTLHSLPVNSTVLCSFPAGTFTLPPAIPDKVVLLSAGVGITPNLAMLNTLVALPKPPSVSWIQGSHNEAEHVFAKHVRDLAAGSNGRIQSVVFYSQATTSSDPNVLPGRMNLDKLDRQILGLEDARAVYYVCGPLSFMSDIAQTLVAKGVSRERINVEAFGASDVSY